MGSAQSIYLKPSGRIYYAILFLAFVLLSALLFLLSQFIPFSVPLGVFALLVLMLLGWGAVFSYFQYYYIHVEDELLTVREGLVSSKMIMIPFNKITEIETRRSPMESIFGVGTIMIDTAGGSGFEVVFRNVPQENIAAFLGLFRRYREKGGNPDSPDKGTGSGGGKAAEPGPDHW